MSWQADMTKLYRKAVSLGVSVDDVNDQLRSDDDWFCEDSSLTLIECLLEHIEKTKK